MHNWGEKDFDWKGLDDAGGYIGENLVRWGRVNVRDIKEKWGTLRIYCSLGFSSLLGITHPRYCHYRPYPHWLMVLDIYVLSTVVSWLNPIVIPYHKWLYRRFYRKAIERWPHLTLEIISAADYHELLTGIVPLDRLAELRKAPPIEENNNDDNNDNEEL